MRFIFLILSLGWTFFAHAQTRTDLEKSVQEIYQHCEHYLDVSTQCKAPFAVKSLPFSSELTKWAYLQALVWADTILESGIELTGQLQLDQALAITKNDEILAYLIFYSQTGIGLFNCEHEDSEGHQDSCTFGTVREASFVSADFSQALQDEDHYAEFEEF